MTTKLIFTFSAQLMYIFIEKNKQYTMNDVSSYEPSMSLTVDFKRQIVLTQSILQLVAFSSYI